MTIEDVNIEIVMNIVDYTVDDVPKITIEDSVMELVLSKEFEVAFFDAIQKILDRMPDDERKALLDASRMSMVESAIKVKKASRS